MISDSVSEFNSLQPGEWVVKPAPSNAEMRELGAWAVHGPGGIYLETSGGKAPRDVAEFVVKAARGHAAAVATAAALSLLHRPLTVFRNADTCGCDPDDEDWGSLHPESVDPDVYVCSERPISKTCESCDEPWPCDTALAAGLVDGAHGDEVWRRLCRLTDYQKEIGNALERAVAAGRDHLMIDELPRDMLAEIDESSR